MFSGLVLVGFLPVPSWGLGVTTDPLGPGSPRRSACSRRLRNRSWLSGWLDLLRWAPMRNNRRSFRLVGMGYIHCWTRKIRENVSRRPCRYVGLKWLDHVHNSIELSGPGGRDPVEVWVHHDREQWVEDWSRMFVCHGHLWTERRQVIAWQVISQVILNPCHMHAS